MPRAASSRRSTRQRSITVGTDFTAGANVAVDRATQLAESTGSRLYVVHVVSQAAVAPSMPLPPQFRSSVAPASQPSGASALRAAADLAAQRLRTETHSVRTTNLVRVGVPHAVLARCARMQRSAALVVGVHRPLSPGESLLLGSTAERALRDGPTPVLLARTRCSGPYRRVLVAVELGWLSLRVVRAAATLTPGAEYDIVHFLAPYGLRGEKSRLQRDSAHRRLLALCASVGLATSSARFHILPGEPREGILAAIRTHMPEVVVMGTHARRGLARMLIGSVADYVIHSAWHVDVLAVPPHRWRTASQSSRVPATAAQSAAAPT